MPLINTYKDVSTGDYFSVTHEGELTAFYQDHTGPYKTLYTYSGVQFDITPDTPITFISAREAGALAGEAKPDLDPRNPLARSRDQWFKSDAGKRALDPSILSSPSLTKYLRNRLESAFIAGADISAKKSSGNAIENASLIIKVSKDNERLRGVFPKIVEALDNGSACSAQSSLEFFELIPEEIRRTLQANAKELRELKVSVRRAIENGCITNPQVEKDLDTRSK